MKQTLTPPRAALELVETLERNGHAAYFVGGCVRDSLLGLEPEDWDVATSARPEQVAACFRGHRVAETGLRHGTVTVVLEGRPLEVTTFRVDGAYSDRRRPDRIVFVEDLRRDLARRDFTVNAMAYHPREGIIDPFGGRADLAAGRIACVGDPARRFGEDALRILRAVRFASTLGFAVAPGTRTAMADAAPFLRHIAPERLRAELDKTLLGKGVGDALRDHRTVLLQVIPELASREWDRLAEEMLRCSADLAVRLTVLLRSCGAAGAEAVLRRLRYDNRTRNRVLLLLREGKLRPTPRSIRWGLNRLGEKDLRRLIAVREAVHPGSADPLERVLREVLAQGDCCRLEDLAVGGGDLLALGVPEGKAVGEMLQTLLGLVLDGSLPNRREALLAAARERMSRLSME